MGVLICLGSMFIGSLMGIIFKEKIHYKVSTTLMCIFGFGAMSIGILYINKVSSLPAVILAIILGGLIGTIFDFEEKVSRFVSYAFNKMKLSIDDGKYKSLLLKAILVFCVSSSGIFGAITEGASGDATILISKAILDFFTAAIFAVTLGKQILFIVIPEAIILLSLYLLGGLVAQFFTTTILADFMATGGLITMIIGFNIAGIKEFAVFNLILSLILIFPISHLFNYLF